MTPLAAAASREIVDLHAEIEALFTGRSRDFSRCERAFSPEMHMVTPEGRLITRADIECAQGDLDGVHAVADPDSMPNPAGGGPLSFKRTHLAAEHVPAAFEDAARGSNRAFAELGRLGFEVIHQDHEADSCVSQ